MTKDERQLDIVNKWIKSNYMSGFEGVTGFGKTRTSVIAMKKSKAKTIIVIVPTISLKDQWNKVLKDFKVKNFTVLVVNTAYNMNLNCDMLVLDEVHTVGAAEQFSLCWKNANFNKLMWLTATFDRKDGLHKELLKIAPKIDSVTFEEALENNWVSNYRIFNIGLDFTDKERNDYDAIENAMNNCVNTVAEEENMEIEYVSQNMFNIARSAAIKYKEEKMSKDSFLASLKYMKLIGLRKTLIHNAQAKKDKALWFLKKSSLKKKKTIIFSQTQDYADYIYNNFTDESVVIHSKMTKKARKEALKKYLDGRTKKRIISSVKALNEGIDIPNLEVGISASGTSSKKDAIQTLGRVCRLYGDKEAIFINLYIKNSQDYYWLKNRQFGLFEGKITWLDN